MLKTMVAIGAIAASLSTAASAQTIVILPEPGSMEPATVIVDPRARHRDPVLVCSSLSQLSTGGCTFRSPAQLGFRRY